MFIETGRPLEFAPFSWRRGSLSRGRGNRAHEPFCVLFFSFSLSSLIFSLSRFLVVSFLSSRFFSRFSLSRFFLPVSFLVSRCLVSFFPFLFSFLVVSFFSRVPASQRFCFCLSFHFCSPAFKCLFSLWSSIPVALLLSKSLLNPVQSNLS